jgi:hypothetical protein
MVSTTPATMLGCREMLRKRAILAVWREVPTFPVSATASASEWLRAMALGASSHVRFGVRIDKTQSEYNETEVASGRLFCRRVPGFGKRPRLLGPKKEIKALSF